MPFRRVFYPDFVLPPEGGGDFDPVATFFSASENGLITDLSSLSNLWQNTDGTGAVTAVNDPIGRIDDVSGNGNHLTADTTKGILKQDSNGKYYIDTNASNTFYNLTSVMADLRSVSMVIADVGSSAYTPLVGHASQYDFHGNATAGIMLDASYAAAVVSGGEWKKDGTIVTPGSTTFPTSPGVVSVRTTGNADAGQISRDRGFGGRDFRGRIYEVFLNSADVGATEMENYRVYLAAKFSL